MDKTYTESTGVGRGTSNTNRAKGTAKHDEKLHRYCHRQSNVRICDETEGKRGAPECVEKAVTSGLNVSLGFSKDLAGV